MLLDSMHIVFPLGIDEKDNFMQKRKKVMNIFLKARKWKVTLRLYLMHQYLWCMSFQCCTGNAKLLKYGYAFSINFFKAIQQILYTGCN